MAKRAAEKYLTDRNVDDVDDEEEPPSEGFEAAPQRELSRRTIRGLPNRSNKTKALSSGNSHPSSMASNPFAALSSASTPPDALAVQQNASSATTDEHPLVIYYTTLRGINASVLSTITNLVNADPFVDLSEALTKISSKYKTEREKANSARGSAVAQTSSKNITSTTSITTATAAPTPSAPTVSTISSKTDVKPATNTTTQVPSLFAPTPGSSAAFSFGSSSTDKTKSKPPTFSFQPSAQSSEPTAIETTTTITTAVNNTANSSNVVPPCSNSKPTEQTSTEPVKVNPFANLNFTMPPKNPTPSIQEAPKTENAQIPKASTFSFTPSASKEPVAASTFSFKPTSDDKAKSDDVKTTMPSFSFGGAASTASTAPKASFSFIPTSTPSKSTSSDKETPASIFGFGSASKTASPARASPSSVGFSFGATNSPGSNSSGGPKFSFGVPPPPTSTNTSTPTSETDSTGGSLFGPPSTTASAFGTSIFSAAPSASTSTPGLFGGVPSTTTTQPTTGSVFGSFGGLKTPPESTPASTATSDIEGDGAIPSAAESQAPTPTLTPNPESSSSSKSVLLGEGAGEEDETVLHELRCKVYEFDKESKSYDKGKVIVLKVKENTATGKMRILGRNYGNGRVEINFLLWKDYKVTADGKTAMFDAINGTTSTLYRLRANSEQDVLSFKSAVEEAVARL